LNLFWLKIGTSGHTEQGHETVNFGSQEVKDIGHKTPKLNCEAWRRHHSRPLWSSGFSNLY